MLNLALPLAATAAVVLVCTLLTIQLRSDRVQPEPRHRPRPQLALPAVPVRDEPAAEPEPFDPLTSPLDQVETFINSLGLAREDTRELEVIA